MVFADTLVNGFSEPLMLDRYRNRSGVLVYLPDTIPSELLQKILSWIGEILEQHF